MKNFWQKLNKKCKRQKQPILCIAPMADVTDLAFREMFAKHGKPSVFFTEFVSADGLALADKLGQKKLLENFRTTQKQKPIVAQIFGANPQHIVQAVRIVKKLDFAGVDINMGCPENKIVKQGAGAGLIRTPQLAKEIILAAKLEAAKGLKKIPVSVKTRIGFNKNEIETWLPEILSCQPAALTLHCRTRKEMSLVPADWQQIKRAVALRDQMQKDLPVAERTLIIGNGDIKTLIEAKQKQQESSCDGIMVGRALFGNPYFFNAKKQKLGVEEKLKLLLEHTQLFEKYFIKKRPEQLRHNFAIMKKHYKAYCAGFDGAKELRIKLMATDNLKEIKQIIRVFLKK